jgi:hypothetical protein
MQPTDFILLRCGLGDPAPLVPAAARLVERIGGGATLYRAAWSPAAQLAYVYVRLPARQRIDASACEQLQAGWRELCPHASGVDVSRLELVFDAPGHSQGQAACFHYVVETDAEHGWFDEISRWYDTEHMPGLAAVDGCIHARRLLNHDSGPQSLACYDLVTEETLGSAAWLAVRNTAWSSVARPHFTNTRRTMLRVLPTE